MPDINEVGELDGWRCWICDEPVDPDQSVNHGRGPSVDSLVARSKSKNKGRTNVSGSRTERLAHRDCNTRKGAVAAVVPWPDHLFVVDPAPIVGVVERLQRKGGREVVARCPTEDDATEAAAWLLDRLSRLSPETTFTTEIDPGGGQHLLVLRV